MTCSIGVFFCHSDELLCAVCCSSHDLRFYSFEISPYGVGVSDVNNYYADRIISVTGNLDGMAKAEELLSEKMRTCMDQDANVFQVGVHGPCFCISLGVSYTIAYTYLDMAVQCEMNTISDLSSLL